MKNKSNNKYAGINQKQNKTVKTKVITNMQVLQNRKKMVLYILNKAFYIAGRKMKVANNIKNICEGERMADNRRRSG